MITNLKTIVKFLPCSKGIAKLMNNLGHNCNRHDWVDVYYSLTPEQQTKDIDFKFILGSNGVKDTFWALCTQPKKIKLLIGADVVESVLHIYEEKYPNDMRVRNCIQGVRDFCNGKITQERLNVLKQDAYAAHATGSTAAANAANGSVYDAAVATTTVAYAAVDVDAFAEQWKKNEEILLKYI